MKIEIWSDITCPWCWLGKHHLAAAIERVGLGDDVELEFRSFELSPDMRGALPVKDYLTQRYGDVSWLAESHARLAEMGARVGIRYDFERAVASNTFDAHRVHHLAKERGLGNEVVEVLMRARQGEGADVADHATLRRLAVETGLDASEVDKVLASDRFADAVRADERTAGEIGVRGVPYFLFDRRYGLSGAQPVEVFEEVLRRMREKGDGLSTPHPV